MLDNHLLHLGHGFVRVREHLRFVKSTSQVCPNEVTVSTPSARLLLLLLRHLITTPYFWGFGFLEDAKLAYVSCPLKVVVDLSSTKMDICVQTPDSAVQPAPTATIAGSSNLAGNQFFDVTALIQEVQEIRQHANNRSSFAVKIQDGSLDHDTQKVKAMPLKIYFDTSRTDPNSAEQPVSGESLKKLVDEHLQSKTAMSFFCISGAQDETGKFCFRNTRHTFITKGVGTKAEQLNNNAELHNL